MVATSIEHFELDGATAKSWAIAFATRLIGLHAGAGSLIPSAASPVAQAQWRERWVDQENCHSTAISAVAEGL